MSQAKRDDVIRQFDKNESRQVLILSLRAGGVGLNLTKANHVVMFDRWWNPSVEAQAIDRAFRIGQLRNVFVHKMLCTATFEERIDEMIEAKRELTELSMSAGEQWISKMSNSELKDLFSLAGSDNDDSA